MNRREEGKAATARKAASALFKVEKKVVPRVILEREEALAAQALKTAQLRALRLEKEADEKVAATGHGQTRSRRS